MSIDTVSAPELSALPGGRPGWPEAGLAVAIVERSRRILAFATVVILAGLGFLLFLLMQAPPPQQEPPVVLEQDFRGSRKPIEPLVLFGPDAERMSKPEEGGWRLTLPAERRTTEPVGLETKAPVRGNFTLTTSYEILRSEQPRSGYGVGFELFVMLATPANDAFGFYRVALVKEGEVFLCIRSNVQRGQRMHHKDVFPAMGKIGQLRVTRQGSDFAFLAKEEGAPDFRELVRYDLGPADLKSIRLAAFTGHAKYPLDLRIVDLKVSADGLVPDNSATVGSSPTRWGRGWLLASGMTTLVIVLCSFGVWLLSRRERRKNHLAASTSTHTADANDITPALLSLECPGCGSRLKVRPVLAGKKVKCPQCGQAVSVL